MVSIDPLVSGCGGAGSDGRIGIAGTPWRGWNYSEKKFPMLAVPKAAPWASAATTAG